jgi:hypothetical protein
MTDRPESSSLDVRQCEQIELKLGSAAATPPGDSAVVILCSALLWLVLR